MSTPTEKDGLFDLPVSKRQSYTLAAALILTIATFLTWPRLVQGLFATSFLPHFYCYLQNRSLVWTHVTADAFVGIAYVSISITLAYLIYRTRRDIPFHWMFLAFGLFIVACGGTHFMEVVTITTDSN